MPNTLPILLTTSARDYALCQRASLSIYEMIELFSAGEDDYVSARAELRRVASINECEAVVDVKDNAVSLDGGNMRCFSSGTGLKRIIDKALKSQPHNLNS